MYIPPPAPALPVDCHLCFVPILNPPSPPRPGVDRDLMSFTWDHVVPLTAGGDDDEGNLRPAHLVCNIRRGNMPLDEWIAGEHWKALPQRPRRLARPKQQNVRLSQDVYDALVEMHKVTGVGMGRIIERGIILEVQRHGFGSDIRTPTALPASYLTPLTTA